MTAREMLLRKIARQPQSHIDAAFVRWLGIISRDADIRRLAEFGSAALSENDAA